MPKLNVSHDGFSRPEDSHWRTSISGRLSLKSLRNLLRCINDLAGNSLS
jgi:hypothetical protein